MSSSNQFLLLRALAMRGLAAAVFAGSCLFASVAVQADPTIKPYFEFKKPAMTVVPGDVSLDTNGAASPVSNATAPYVLGFEGISQYDGVLVGRNAIPPDTNGAVGMTQYLEVSNGAYAIFDKTTGNRLSLVSDVAFWASAGRAGANGDSRVMYNAAAQRWVVASFGANVKDIQIAVSDTDNALGTWKSTTFEGYAGEGFGGAVADYPTLALDKNAVYIGTNNFAPAVLNGTTNLRSTTLNVIPINSLFSGAAPTTTNMKQFTTSTSSDRGFAIQGVNSTAAGTTGKAAAVSLFFFDNLTYDVNSLSPTSATTSTLSAVDYVGMAAYTAQGAARQPAVAVPANQRVIDSLDDRISSSVYEANGRIYLLNTLNSSLDGLDEARVRYTVLDSATRNILDQGDIGTAGFDYYQGSIAVNSFGQVVIGYNRSGLTTADLNSDGLSDGNISFMARTFNTQPNGQLLATSGEILLKVSLTDDYHNGSNFGLAASGRQRWGDYSQVSVDPANPLSFWLVGQFAREYNNAAGGHPGGSGASRWGTWIAQLTVSPVPEPATWSLTIFAIVAVGRVARQRRR